MLVKSAQRFDLQPPASDNQRVQRVYDLVMTHKLDADDLFIHRLQQFCGEARLNFFLVEPLWIEEFLSAFVEGRVWTRVLLNMHSEHHDPNDIFHRLVRLAAERKTFVIDPPDQALAAFDKARLHPKLVAAGLQVPYTVVVPGAQAPNFQLTAEQAQALGQPFVIKPALGYGRRGVILDATSERDLARSAAAWPGGDYLLQRRIVPRELDSSPAYFRVFFVFGAVFYTWWNCYTDCYRMLNPLETQIYNLKPLETIVRQVAALTGMNFFSSEIAQTEAGEFVLIDYVNDQCHMLSQSSDPRIGVPDRLVTAIARQLVLATKQVIARPSVPAFAAAAA